MVSRRDFLRSSIMLPGSAAIAAQRGGAVPLRVAVVGAGAFGGWTALHLRRAGALVTLLDAWGPGNSRASSGGETRVIRTIYGLHGSTSRWPRGRSRSGASGTSRPASSSTDERAC